DASPVAGEAQPDRGAERPTAAGDDGESLRVLLARPRRYRRGCGAAVHGSVGGAGTRRAIRHASEYSAPRSGVSRSCSAAPPLPSRHSLSLVELRHLRYFLAVVDFGSLNKAAAHLL